MVDFTLVIKAIIELALTVASAFLIPYLKTKWDSSRIEKMMHYVDIGVLAAEQLFTAEQWQEKKEYVQVFLATKGYQINSMEVDSAIESAVKRIKTELQK